jgi:hypothetical protein
MEKGLSKINEANGKFFAVIIERRGAVTLFYGQ